MLDLVLGARARAKGRVNYLERCSVASLTPAALSFIRFHGYIFSCAECTLYICFSRSYRSRMLLSVNCTPSPGMDAPEVRGFEIDGFTFQ